MVTRSRCHPAPGLILATALLATALLCLGVPRASGADDARDRKARVALALAAAAQPPALAVAPAPRPTSFPGYTAGYKLSLEQGLVFVAYVGCAGRHPVEALPGAVVAVAETLAGYPPGTIVIGYPAAGQMIEHVRLDCDRFAEVPAAVEAARKKLGAAVVPRAPVAPQPLDWVIYAAPLSAPGCVGLT